MYIKEVDWTYRKTTGAADVNVWNRKWLVNGYKSCCTIETTAAGTYNLVIYQVTRNRTGFYDCVERGGLGKRQRIRLDVQPPVVTTPQIRSSREFAINTLLHSSNSHITYFPLSIRFVKYPKSV